MRIQENKSLNSNSNSYTSSSNVTYYTKPNNTYSINNVQVTNNNSNSVQTETMDFSSSKGRTTDNLHIKLLDAAEVGLATGAVVTTSVASGVFKVGEAISDGMLWTGCKVFSGIYDLEAGFECLINNEEKRQELLKNKQSSVEYIKNYIARDKAEENNKRFYEGTNIGIYINEKSKIKYDSKAANAIQSVSEAVTLAAVEASATILTGGVGGAYVGGFYGAGRSAEGTYQNNMDTGVLDEGLILLSGGLGALSGYSSGVLYNKFTREIGTSVAAYGWKNTGTNFVKTIANKEFAKAWLKTSLKDPGNYLSAAMMSADEAGKFITGEKEFNVKNIAQLTGTYALNLGFNVLEDGFRSSLNGFRAKEVNVANIVDLQKVEKETINYLKYVQENQDKVDRYNELKRTILSNHFVDYCVSKIDNPNTLDYRYENVLDEFSSLQDEFKNVDGLNTLVDLKFDGHNFIKKIVENIEDDSTAELSLTVSLVERINNHSISEEEAKLMSRLETLSKENSKIREAYDVFAKDYNYEVSDELQNMVNSIYSKNYNEINDIANSLSESELMFAAKNGKNIAENITPEFGYSIRYQYDDFDKENFIKKFRVSLDLLPIDKVHCAKRIINRDLDLGDELNKKVFDKYINGLLDEPRDVNIIKSLNDFARYNNIDESSINFKTEESKLIYNSAQDINTMISKMNEFTKGIELNCSTEYAGKVITFGVDDYLKNNKYTSGYNNGTITVIRPTTGNRLYDVLYHETIHQLSYKEGYSSGFRLQSDRARLEGINEATTEYFTQLIRGNDYVVGRCGYEDSVKELRKIIDNNLLSLDDLKKGYFNNDIDYVIKKLGLSEKDANTLLYGFSKMNDCDFDKTGIDLIRREGQREVAKIINKLILKNKLSGVK